MKRQEKSNARDPAPSGNNTERQAEARTRLQRKIYVLERIYAEGIPAGCTLPSSMAQLRDWEDANLDVRRIGSPSTTNARLSQKNADLIGEAGLVLDKIRKALRGRRRRPYVPIDQRLALLKQDLESSKEAAWRYSCQAVTYLHERDEALREKKVAEDDAKLYRDTCQDLRKQLNVLDRRGPRAVP